MRTGNLWLRRSGVEFLDLLIHRVNRKINMHEFSVMSSVVIALLEELEHLEREDGKEIEKVNEVILDLGELTFLAREQLEFCYTILSEENKLKGSKLVIKNVPIEVHCHECGYTGSVEYFREFHFTTPILQCPKCKGIVEIVKGRECAIRSINLEVKDGDKEEEDEIKE